MKFIVSKKTYMESKGFDTSNFRKSLDEVEVVLHYEFAIILIPNLENDDNITIFDSTDKSFLELLESEKWKEEI